MSDDANAVRVPPAQVVAGRETDARVARALGYGVIEVAGPYTNSGFVAVPILGSGGVCERLPSYSRDAGAVEPLTQELAKRGLSLRSAPSLIGAVAIVTDSAGREWEGEAEEVIGHFPALPLACVRAALAALEGDPR